MKSRVIFNAKHSIGGFTLVEVLLALGILLLVSFMSLPIYQNFSFSRDVSESTDTLVAVLRAARTRSVARLSGATHGVFFDVAAIPPRYVLYQVPAAAMSIDYASRDPAYDYMVTLGRAFSLSTTIPGNDIFFTRGSGAPSVGSSASVTLSHSTGGARVIDINTRGLIEKR